MLPMLLENAGEAEEVEELDIPEFEVARFGKRTTGCLLSVFNSTDAIVGMRTL